VADPKKPGGGAERLASLHERIGSLAKDHDEAVAALEAIRLTRADARRLVADALGEPVPVSHAKPLTLSNARQLAAPWLFGATQDLGWEAFLTSQERAELESDLSTRSSGMRPWDPWDYGVVGGAALAATVIDWLLVSVPSSLQQSPVVGTRGGIATPVSDWIKRHVALGEKDVAGLFGKALPPDFIKVSYDMVGRVPGSADGLSGANHRIRTLGHDPLLGLLFGTRDILNNTMSVWTRDGGWTTLQRGGDAATGNPLVAIFKVVIHLLSDAFRDPARTGTLGVPAPGMVGLQNPWLDHAWSLVAPDRPAMSEQV
jgi:hypothetical protein